MTTKISASPFKILTTLFCVITSFGFAQNKQELTLPGLNAPVEVLRDKWGMNHIYAKNQHDLFYAQGYCAIKDRPFQFELWRRQATGTVAELLGAGELKRDIGARLFKFRGEMTKELKHYHPQGVAIISAYVAGINAYVEETFKNPDQLPIEFKTLKLTLGKWTPEIVISRHQGLKGNINEELATGRAVAIAGADKIIDLMWFHPKTPNLELDKRITLAMLSENILELYNKFHNPISFLRVNRETVVTSQYIPKAFEHGVEGSNNWIVSGNKTASGLPILANDPHRSITLPSLRYMVHLNAPGWNVIGGGEPTIPGVSIGHNESGAWGLTIFETDSEDLYVYDLNPANLTQYRYKNKWVSMTEINESIPIKGAKNVNETLRYTLHGPVTFIDSARHKAYAIRCAWLEPGGAPYLASLRINQAKTWSDFRNASKFSNLPGENMIWADKKGNIGWQVVGIAPIRKNFSGMVPVPGDGKYEWAGFLNIKKRPHSLNPEKKFFATANQNVTPDNYNHWNTIGYAWADPFRGDRINEVLTESKNITIEQTEALQTDYVSIPARTLIPMLKNISFNTELSLAAKQQLNNWNYSLDENSVAAGIYAMWERKLNIAADEKFIPKELKGLVDIQLKKIISWIEHPDARFGADPIKERDALLQGAFEQAVEELKLKLGSDVNNWAYGKYKYTSFTHPLNAFLPTDLKGSYDLGPLPKGGNSHTVNSTGGADRQGSGASFRFITDISDWDKALMINTPGQSADPESKYYSNLFKLWAGNGYFPAYFSRTKIESVTDEKTTLKPK